MGREQGEEMMKMVFAFFAATRYWTEQEHLAAVYQNAANQVKELADVCILIQDGNLKELPEADPDDCLVVVPMSGAVQKAVLETASNYRFICLCASGVPGNFEESLSKEMLRLNASPTLMDSWSVLKRTHDHAFLAVDFDELRTVLNVIRTYSYVKGAKLLLIGETEPWVISNSRCLSVYKEWLGVEILQIGYEELIQLYEETGEEETEKFVHHFKENAHATVMLIRWGRRPLWLR